MTVQNAGLSRSAVGGLVVALVVLGLALTVMRYVWPLLLAGSVGCLATYLLQVRKDRREEAEIRDAQEYLAWRRREADRTAQLLAAAQPRTPADRFATCPRCRY